MHLIISDVHFGKSSAEIERAKERDLIACLLSYRDDVASLILLGDIFENYIEYRHLVPKGFSRFQGLLASWADSKIPISYFVGNNDPWHRDYFADEFGAQIEWDERYQTLAGHKVYLAHGDGVGDAWSKYRLLKPILRHPLPVFLYRALLPGDFGIRLAKLAKGRIGDDNLDESNILQLRKHAANILQTDKAEFVVMGHTHYPESIKTNHGNYINTGSWHHNRTFGIADDQGIRLMVWEGATAREISPNSEAPARLNHRYSTST